LLSAILGGSVEWAFLKLGPNHPIRPLGDSAPASSAGLRIQGCDG
jgi:hypothetical protein